MSRRKSGLPLHGWLVIDKPVGMSSAHVVAKVLRMTGARKAGHGGTLDPLASGVLPVALGEATKTVSWVMDGRKTYQFTIRWGEERSSDDLEGDVTFQSDKRPQPADILAVLPQFTGEIMQIPPVFSAIKLDGRRAYQMARNHENPDLAPRPVRIDALIFIGQDGDEASFQVDCGKGTYVRSLARDIGRVLGCLGTISSLRRTGCGPFTEKDTICLDKLEEFGHSANSAELLLPVESVLDDIPAVNLTDDEASRLQRGQFLPLDRMSVNPVLPDIPENTIFTAMSQGRVVALARIEGGEIRPVRVLNLN